MIKNLVLLLVLVFITSCSSGPGSTVNLNKKLQYLELGMSKNMVRKGFGSQPIYKNQFGKEVLIYCSRMGVKRESFLGDLASELAMRPYEYAFIWFKDNKLVGYSTTRRTGVNVPLVNDRCQKIIPEVDWSLFPE